MKFCDDSYEKYKDASGKFTSILILIQEDCMGQDVLLSYYIELTYILKSSEKQCHLIHS